MEENSEHIVYILECKDNTFYTGYTNDLARRLRMHANGKGAKYTRGRGPFQLVYQQKYITKQEAMKEEYQIKKLSRKEKVALIEQYEERQDVHANSKQL
ncbi:GIY-YIG nuclease family protein [Aquibacillus sp. 3ASR75-11]|uniref:GIY-YIG nuclease family protein n=1 Tax=Terrihalobacillus insolitus TaxID=2950438 RepID=A0A9X3WUI8_9BACI|nr:GIY-YIG nuclease family protein [Terrihalobacillus insolitus]MDC3414883.1 GIY-YIG nuclease family protein [Terrihalobacillus insolitus]MDC3426032.1 GIY-YIG nuclease family protein [Terrihalobacillus insolitus]